MIRDIITYPTPPSAQYNTDVRVFDEVVFSLLDDLKETIIANNLEGLAAFQIGNYLNAIVIKREDGSFLELINARLISNSGRTTTIEKTAYFPNLSAEVTRFEKIMVIYQDRDAIQHSLNASGAEAILLQRKIDYVFGSNFLNKLSPEEKKRFKQKLEFGSDVAISEVCPTTFKRDYIIKAMNYVMIAMVGVLIGSFFTEMALLKAQMYLALSVFILNIIYFFYAQYEGKKFTSCTSCQIGNIIGTAVIILIKLSIITLVSYFLL